MSMQHCENENDMVVRCAPCDATPGSVGYDPERLSFIHRHVQSLIDEKNIWSGSYCLWKNGKVFADAAIGTLARPWMGNSLFQPDTLFELQSVGKVFTALAILKLMEDGKLHLDQPVKDWLPEFDEGDFREIKILHLLTHTSGICALEGAYPQDERNWQDKMDPKDPEHTWLSAVVKTGLHAKPGKLWLYSVVGYQILGEIIKRASGMAAEEFIKQSIFLPCEMRDIHWRKDATEAQLRRYNIANETDLAMAAKADRSGIQEMAAPTYPTWPGIPDTAGGQMSTCREMMQLAEMLLRGGTYRGKRVLGKTVLEFLWTNLIGDDVRDLTFGRNAGIRYGAGMPIYSAEYDREQALSEGTIYHEGAGTCVFLVDRREDFAAMFQTSFRKEFDWDFRAVKGLATIIWSGLK